MLQIDSVSKLYKGGDKALDNISFSVEQGEFISVIGKSGAGKTTLFRLLNGMIKPTAGRIIINNQDFTKLKGRKKREIDIYGGFDRAYNCNESYAARLS